MFFGFVAGWSLVYLFYPWGIEVIVGDGGETITMYPPIEVEKINGVRQPAGVRGEDIAVGIGAVIMAVMWIWSYIDAVLVADRINRAPGPQIVIKDGEYSLRAPKQ